MNYAAILGGGKGTRFGGSLPKQFSALGDKTVLEYAVTPFYRCADIEGILVVLPKQYLSLGEELLYRAFCDKERIKVTAGGDDRMGSLLNACAFLYNKGAQEDDILLTHDAARPFASEAMIADQLAKIADFDCVTAAVPAVDTVLRSENGISAADIPARKTMFAVQTPQTFRFGTLYRELKSLTEAEKEQLTDGCGLFLRRGKSVGLALGDRKNLKITAAEDIAVAEVYL